MGSVLHANAKTTPRIRQEIKESKESIRYLSKLYNLTPKTIIKWKNASSVEDGLSGGNRSSRSLTKQEEQIICEVRRITKFALDDILILLKDNIPKLTRSNLYRTLKRHNLNVLPIDDIPIKSKSKFKDYKIGYIHIDITRLTIKGQILYLFVAIDRVCKYAYVQIYTKQTIKNACSFLNDTLKDFPFKVHTILTDNGAQFTYELLAKHLKPKHIHPFDVICNKHNIKHRLTKFKHPWTNGQVEIFNKIFKQHTTKRYYYDNEQQLREHAKAFILLYNYQKKLKSYKLKTPYELYPPQNTLRIHYPKIGG